MNKLKKLLSWLLSLIIVIMALSPSINAYAEDYLARVITIHSFDGDTVTLSRDNARGRTPRVRQRLTAGHILSTGRGSNVYLRMDRNSLFHMDERSSVTVGSSGRRMSLTLQSGSLLVEVAEQSEGQTVSSRVGNVGLGVRGTMFTMGRGATDVVTIVMLSGSGYVNEVPLPAGAMMTVWDGLDDRFVDADGVFESGQHFEVRFELDMEMLDLHTLAAINRHSEYLIEIGTVTYEDIELLPELIATAQAERDTEASAEDTLIAEIMQTIDDETIIYLTADDIRADETDTGATLPVNQAEPPIDPSEPTPEPMPESAPEPEPTPDPSPEPPSNPSPAPTPSPWGILIGSGLTGTVGGNDRAPWRLYECGLLVVDEGFIEWTNPTSPWSSHSDAIERIVFTGPINGGNSLAGLFRDLYNVTSIDGLSFFDTSSVTNMNGMFLGARSLTSLDLSSWDTGSVTNMAAMFGNASGLTSLDLSGWDTSSVTDMSWMLYEATSLSTLILGADFRFVGGTSAMLLDGFWQNGTTGPVYTSVELMANEPATMAGTWVRHNTIPRTIDSGLTGTVGGDSRAPWRLYESGLLVVDEGFIEGIDLNVSPWYVHRDAIERIVFTGPISGGNSLAGLFNSLFYVTAIEGLSNFDTRNVTAMSGMFALATSLTSLDLSGWDTSNVVDMRFMFSQVVRLTSLDLSSWDTSSVTHMDWMFWNSGLTSLDLSGWDTSSVIWMDSMFSHVRLTSLDLSGWDTSSVTGMNTMFQNSDLTSLDLSGWDTNNVVDMRFMFCGASGLTSLNLSNWNTSNVTDMDRMFGGTSSLTSLDLSGWDTSSVTNMNSMFSGASSLGTLILGADFRFVGGDSAELRDGFWQNSATGYVYTSAELMANAPATMAGTWIRHDISPRGGMVVSVSSLFQDGLLLMEFDPDSDGDGVASSDGFYYRKEDGYEDDSDKDDGDYDDDEIDGEGTEDVPLTDADNGTDDCAVGDCGAGDESNPYDDSSEIVESPDYDGYAQSENEPTALEGAMGMLDELLKLCGKG